MSIDPEPRFSSLSIENDGELNDVMSSVSSSDEGSLILISACLAGVSCRFDGKTKIVEKFKKLVDEGKAMAFCPEVAGKMPVPRPPSEMTGGTGEDILRCNGILTETGGINRERLRAELFPIDKDCCCETKIINKNGKDVTNYYIRGAIETLKTAEKYGIRKAVLKARSPACGKGKVYDGTFGKVLIDGNGVAAELLMRAGVEVFTGEEFQV